jgi:hypothetical protein
VSGRLGIHHIKTVRQYCHRVKSKDVLEVIECRDRVGSDQLRGEGVPLGDPSEELVSSATFASLDHQTRLGDTYTSAIVLYLRA